MNKIQIIFTIFFIFIILMCQYGAYKIGYNRGATMTLDAVSKMLDKRFKLDTCKF